LHKKRIITLHSIVVCDRKGIERASWQASRGLQFVTQNSNFRRVKPKSASRLFRNHQSPLTMARNIFSVPAPIRQLFDKFPLVTYPQNDLPLRTHRDRHVLYVFVTEDGAAAGAPSYNPACLKWQVSRNTTYEATPI